MAAYSITSADCHETSCPGWCSHVLDSLHHTPFYQGAFLPRGQFVSYILSFYIHVCRKPEEGDLTFKGPCCARNIHIHFLKHEKPREFEFSFQEQINNNLLHLFKYKRPFSSHLGWHIPWQFSWVCYYSTWKIPNRYLQDRSSEGPAHWGLNSSFLPRTADAPFWSQTMGWLQKYSYISDKRHFRIGV